MALGAMCILYGAVPAAAQQADTTADSTSVSRSAADAPLISKRDITLFAGAALTTIAVVPLDRPVERRAHLEDLRHRGIRQAADAFGFTGGPGPFIAGGALYLGGVSSGSPRVARLGVTMTEGVLLAATLNGIVKGFAGRALPNAPSREPGEFSFGRGFHDGNGPFVSFPSGHTAASFAAAAVLSEEASTWSSPVSRFVAPAAYGTATLVAISRLYENVHWASDLPLGAAIGVWSGRTVAAWQRRHPDNWLMRRLPGIGVSPSKHRLTITAMFPFAHR
jgi:membrane-associated phospholipid phosphatase